MKKIVLLVFNLLFCTLFYIPQAHADSMSPMRGMYGTYTMAREASGTSWQPDSTCPQEIMHMFNGGMLMYSGFINSIYDKQGGPRGDTKNFSSSMGMLMAQKNMDFATIGLRTMFSLDPLMGKSGYPLLLQTGETANGKTPLIDRQHPHDAVMELAAIYSQPLQDKPNDSFFAYFGWPGEPALGPPVFMHRWSGINIPEAPLSHHWMDSTHITYGVMTLGYIRDNIKLEGSLFKGREPDQYRWDIERLKLDSGSLRFSYNPTENWSLQISHGYLNSPEQLEPEINTHRSTMSIVYNKYFNNSNNWQTILAWGQNNNNPGHTLYAYMLESAASLQYARTIFTRIERLQKDELEQNFITKKQPIFTVNKVSIGYIQDFPFADSLQFGIGALASTYFLPTSLYKIYSKQPFSYMLFARLKLGA